MQWPWIVYLIALFVWLYHLPFHILLVAQVLAVYWPRRKAILPRADQRFVILIPAHDEELHIQATLVSLKALDYPEQLFELVVIADNCQDQTANLARAMGVTVWERSDAEHRSKGFALAYALRQLQQRTHHPDAVLVIDADTLVDRGLLKAFAGRLAAGQLWIQGYYSVANAETSPRTRLMTYAFSLFNGSWLWGLDRLGIGCAFRGNGMCFAWEALQKTPWQAHGLAEDLEFSWYLRSQGERIYFVAEAKVYGEIFAQRTSAAKAQQLRWEHGRKQLREGYGLAIQSFPQSRWRRYLLSADLYMPPLSRYVSFLLLFLLLTVGFCSWSVEGSRGACELLTLMASLSLGAFGLYLLSPFVRLGLPTRFAASLLTAPYYMLWKISLLGSKAPKVWTRTKRGGESDS